MPRPPKFTEAERQSVKGYPAGWTREKVRENFRKDHGKKISPSEITRIRNNASNTKHRSIPSRKRKCPGLVQPEGQESAKRRRLNSHESEVANDHTQPCLDADAQESYGSGEEAESSTEDPSYPHAQLTSSPTPVDLKKVVIDLLDAPDQEATEAIESPMHPDLNRLLGPKNWLNDNVVYWMLDLFTAGPNKAIEGHLFRPECNQQPPISTKSCLVLGPLNHGDAHWVLIAMKRSKGGLASFHVYDSWEPSYETESIEAMTRFKGRVTSIKLNDPQEMWCPKQANTHDCGLHVGINGLCRHFDEPPLEHIENSWWRFFFYKLLIYKRVRKMRAQSGATDSLQDYEVPPTGPSLPPHVLQGAPILSRMVENRLTEARKSLFEASKSYVAACQDYDTEEKNLYRLKKEQAKLKNDLEPKARKLELREKKLRELRDDIRGDEELLEAVTNTVEEKVRTIRASIQETEQALEDAKQSYDNKKRIISTCEQNWSQARSEARQRLLELAKALEGKAELIRTIDQDQVNRRATIELDLSKPDSSQQPQIDRLRKALNGRKIVVLSGAGISVSAGIPDFRSDTGLFVNLRRKHKLRYSGKDIFHRTVYDDKKSLAMFHEMIRDLAPACKSAKPTELHRMVQRWVAEGRVLRNYTQNIDGIETQLPQLQTMIPLPHPKEGRTPKLIQLHGTLLKMVCVLCKDMTDINPELFNGPNKPPCEVCEKRVNSEGKRKATIGWRRPRLLLYGEPGDDDEAIRQTIKADLEAKPDVLFVFGTSLKVPGVQALVKDMGSVAGLRVWCNKDPPPKIPGIEWDLIVRGCCDELAKRASHLGTGDSAKESFQAARTLLQAERMLSQEHPLATPPFHQDVGGFEILAVVKSRHKLNQECLEEALAATKDAIASSEHERSRAATELPGYASELGRCMIPTIMGYDEYMATNWAEESIRLQHRNTLALMTMGQATAALRNGPKPFPIPILIPIELNPSESHPFDAKRYLDVLATKKDVSVHIYYDAPPPNKNFSVPKLMSGKQAIEALQSSKPANILDIRGGSIQLECLDSNSEYSILDDLAFGGLDLNDTIGKEITALGEFIRTTFSLISNPPAWSDWHCDRHGTVTAIKCEYGNKGWFMRPGLLKDEREQWKREQVLPLPAIAVGLKEGDHLLMPPSTPHGPMTLPSGKVPDVCKMSGRMHLSLHGLVNSVEQTLEDEENSAGTNESTANDFWEVMERIWHLWGNRSPAWEWPPDDQYTQFSGIIQERKARQQELKTHACKCKGGCGKACGCVKKRSPCNERCHTDDGGDKCVNTAASRSESESGSSTTDESENVSNYTDE